MSPNNSSTITTFNVHIRVELVAINLHAAAFPTLPELPPLPRTVQADRWLWRYHHRIFARLIGSDGCVAVNHETYYISTSLAGQKVALVVDAKTASFDVVLGASTLKRLPIKEVVRDELPL